MNSKKLVEFRISIDNDSELKSKRGILIGLSVIMIAFNVAGASLEEVNTFIFKLKISNHDNLVYLFFISIMYMTMRYYGYAKQYHDQLFKLWSDRMLKDYRVFHYTPKVDEINGLLSGGIDAWPGDESGIQSPGYPPVSG